MRFLIDECIDIRIADALAAAGHDVEEARIKHTGMADIDLAAIAVASGRVVVTDDRGFSELAFRDRIPMAGVIFVRMAGRPYQERVDRILRAIAQFQDRIATSIVVVESGNLRIRPLLRLV